MPLYPGLNFIPLTLAHKSAPFTQQRINRAKNVINIKFNQRSQLPHPVYGSCDYRISSNKRPDAYLLQGLQDLALK